MLAPSPSTLLVVISLLLLLSRPRHGGVSALRVTPGSSCASLCDDGDEAEASTNSTDIACRDSDYADSSTGVRFRQCQDCLQNSTAVGAGGDEDDVSWFLYNLRYAVDVCLYSYPNNGTENISVSASCDTANACGPLRAALVADDLAPANATALRYCDEEISGANGFAGGQLDLCYECLQSHAEVTYMANFLTALKAGCQQKPAPGQLLGLSGTLFTRMPVNITSTSTSTTTTSSRSDADSSSQPGLSKGAIAGIAVGVVALFLVVVAMWWTYHRRQKRLYRDLDTTPLAFDARGKGAASSYPYPSTYPYPSYQYQYQVHPHQRYTIMPQPGHLSSITSEADLKPESERAAQAAAAYYNPGNFGGNLSRDGGNEDGNSEYELKPQPREYHCPHDRLAEAMKESRRRQEQKEAERVARAAAQTFVQTSLGASSGAGLADDNNDHQHHDNHENNTNHDDNDINNPHAAPVLRRSNTYGPRAPSPMPNLSLLSAPPPRPATSEGSNSSKADSYALQAYLDAAEDAAWLQNLCASLPGPPPGPPPNTSATTISHGSAAQQPTRSGHPPPQQHHAPKPLVLNTIPPPPPPPPAPPAPAHTSKRYSVPALQLPSVLHRLRLPRRYAPPGLVGLQISDPLAECDGRLVDQRGGRPAGVVVEEQQRQQQEQRQQEQWQQQGQRQGPREHGQKGKQQDRRQWQQEQRQQGQRQQQGQRHPYQWPQQKQPRQQGQGQGLQLHLHADVQRLPRRRADDDEPDSGTSSYLYG